MRSLTYLVACTLDGFIAGPDGADPTSWWPVTPDYLDHLVADYPETLPAAARAALGIDGPGQRFDTVLEGRNTHRIGLDAGVADAYPHLRHLVFSRTLDAVDAAIELVADDPVERVRRLKAEPGGGIWLCGGGALAGALADEIDELVLKQAPISLGAGIGLFGDAGAANRRAWTLTESTVLPGGAAILTYRRTRDDVDTSNAAT